MPQQNSIDKLFNQLIEDYKKEMGLFLVGVIFAGGILLSFLFSRRGAKSEIQVVANSADEAHGRVAGLEAAVTPVTKIKIDVAGAVNNPSVCELEEGSRVQDVIDSAGGFSDQSDSDWIAKNINLAQKVADGEKIYIPTQEELQEESNNAAIQNSSSSTSTLNYSSNSTSSGTSSSNTSPQVTGMINVNTATAAELDTLPGIGSAYAQRIIDARPFSSIEEITRVKGIGTKTLEGVKDRICVE